MCIRDRGHTFEDHVMHGGAVYDHSVAFCLLPEVDIGGKFFPVDPNDWDTVPLMRKGTIHQRRAPGHWSTGNYRKGSSRQGMYCGTCHNPHYDPGYSVLIDKDKLTKNLPKASGTARPPERPSEKDFRNTLSDFWLNAYHVAKYLWRRDLWQAKHHDWLMKGNLLEMMGWHSSLVGGQQSFTTYQGKGLQGWISPETFTSLMTVFGRFYPADSWRALEDTIKLFTKLSYDVGEFLNTDPGMNLRDKFMPLIKELQTNPPE